MYIPMGYRSLLLPNHFCFVPQLSAQIRSSMKDFSSESGRLKQQLIRASSSYHMYPLPVHFALSLMLLMANLTNIKWCKNLKNDRNTGIWVLILEYSVRGFQWIPTWQDLEGFYKNLCILVLWNEVALALEGLTILYPKRCRKIHLQCNTLAHTCTLWSHIFLEILISNFLKSGECRI